MQEQLTGLGNIVEMPRWAPSACRTGFVLEHVSSNIVAEGEDCGLIDL